MNLRLFNYREPDLLSGNIDNIIQSHTNTILTDIVSSNSFTKVIISEKLINDRAQQHADKWIEETAIHLSLYSSAGNIRPRLSAPSSLSSKQRSKILKYKSFSGDVSGVIGESIFSSLLIEHFKLTDLDFAHFRATAKSGIYPDFGIYNPSRKLLRRKNWGQPYPSIELPLPAEVKTVTDPATSAVKGRLDKAIQQIRNYWNTEGSKGASIVCIALRNATLRSYDLALIWGQ